ncbi:hypothetical protein OZX60_01810 [Streptococcaceae bacterium ESL0687]|nr:hypothetical protein OZX60_01810 [Streptococcaceae bacterium ESL0687]
MHSTLKKIITNFIDDLSSMSKDSRDLFKDQKDLRHNKRKIKKEIFDAQVAGLQIKRDYKLYSESIQGDLKDMKDSQKRLRNTVNQLKENIKKLDD